MGLSTSNEKEYHLGFNSVEDSVEDSVVERLLFLNFFGCKCREKVVTLGAFSFL